MNISPLNFSVWLNNVRLLDFPANVDVLINLSVTKCTDTPGMLKYDAMSDVDYYGEKELAFDIFFGEVETDEDVFTLGEEQLQEVKESYKDQIDMILWDKIKGVL